MNNQNEIPQLTILDTPRNSYVTRWHSVNTLRNQTLAEHHHLVRRFSVHLAQNIITDITIESLFAMSEYAGVHDEPEILLGDQPSPAKRHLEKLYNSNNPLKQLEDEIAPWLRDMRNNLRETAPELLIIVKLSDLIDALLFISTEGVGKHAQKVIKILDHTLKAKLQEAHDHFPQYEWQKAVTFFNELLESEGDTQINFEVCPGF